MADKTIEELEKKLAALQEEKKDVEAALASTKEEKEAADQKIKDLEEASAGKDELLKEAHESLSETSKPSAGNRPVITHGKEKYVMTSPKSTVKKDGKTITVTEKVLREDKDLVKYLVEKIKSGILVKEADFKPVKKED